jgi:hypothetical protein
MVARVATVFSLCMLLGVQAGSSPKPDEQCRYIPGDVGWPSEGDWTRLNSTTGGKVIAAIPAASICHGKTYAETACANLKQEWDFPQAR